MLNGRLQIHDIRDVEAFCSKVVERQGAELLQHEREDLLADLISYTWELEFEYDSSRFRRFSVWATYKLNNESVNWIRRKRGRTKWQFSRIDPATGKPKVHIRELPKFHSLDDQPGIVDDYGQMEAGSDRLSSASRLFGTGDSEDPRGDDGMGEDAVRTAA